MTHYTQDKLTNLGYRIENALITNVDLSMADHGCLVERPVDCPIQEYKENKL